MNDKIDTIKFQTHFKINNYNFVFSFRNNNNNNGLIYLIGNLSKILIKDINTCLINNYNCINSNNLINLFSNKNTLEYQNIKSIKSLNNINVLDLMYNNILKSSKVNLYIKVNKIQKDYKLKKASSNKLKKKSMFKKLVNQFLVLTNIYVNKFVLENKLYLNIHNRNKINKELTNNCNCKLNNSKILSYHKSTIKDNTFFIIIVLVIIVVFVFDKSIVKEHLLQETNKTINELKFEYEKNKCPSTIPALKAFCLNIEHKIIELNSNKVTNISIIFSWVFDSIKAANHRLGNIMSLVLIILIIFSYKIINK